MDRSINILRNHDTSEVVGKVYEDEGKTIAEFIEPIPKPQMLPCGYLVIESEERQGTEYLKKVEILEFSIYTNGR